MAIIDMKRIFLLGHQDERGKVIRILRNLGSVELVNVKEEAAWTEMSSYLVPDQATDKVADLDSKLSEVRYCLEFLNRHFPIKKGLLDQLAGGKISLTQEEFEKLPSQEEVIKNIYTSCRKADDTLMQLKNELVKNESLTEELTPWLDLDLPLSQVTNTERVGFQLLTVPLKNLPDLQSKLEESFPAHSLEVVKQGKDVAYCFLAYLTAEEKEVKEVLKEAEYNPVSFPGISTTPAEAIAQIRQNNEGIQKEQMAVREQLQDLLACRPQLMAYYDFLSGERSKYDAVSNLGRTESSFYLEGWVPAPALAQLEAALANSTETTVILARDPEEEEKPPVLLHNKNSLADAHEVVTNLYSTPQYTELDPTPLLTPFFIVFFGICMGDVGYGVLLALLAYIMKKKFKLGGMGKKLINVLFVGGISSIFFGALLGSYFGDLIKLSPLWFNPLDNPMQMLIFCFALGVVQIFAGLAVKAYRNITSGQVLNAIFDEGLWSLFLIGLILLLVGINPAGKWLSIAGAIGLVLTQGRAQKNILKKFFSGVLSLYNVTSYLSDVLSYSRLLALGLATGVIAMAINTMGNLLAVNIIGYIAMTVLLVGGHFFNLLIGVLGAFVHTCRLQYIEFFGKFFEGGGKPFRPLCVRNQYVDVEEREAL